MAEGEIDLSAIALGSITAPAGCGKTQLIVESLSHHHGSKPALVLTHTNAGVFALRARLGGLGVSAKSYVVSTIDGWAMRLISSYPKRSGHDPDILRLSSPGTDYPKIRRAAVKLLGQGDLDDILQASYARLIVDEYQDCSLDQHAIVCRIADMIPTVVLGDPLQAIFGFRSDKVVDWDRDVSSRFPPGGELTKPWRWINAGSEPLGEWVLCVRQHLLQSQHLLQRRYIDLRSAPSSVKWVELDGSNDHQKRLAAARSGPPVPGGTVLVIGDSRNSESRRRIASQTPGAIVIEPVDLQDFISFACDYDVHAPDALAQLTDFASSLMTNVGSAHIVHRVQSLLRGRARNAPADVERIAMDLIQTPSYTAAAELLIAIRRQPGVRIHRPVVYSACVQALQSCDGSDGASFHEAAIRIREQSRFSGRQLPSRAVGSTLLLKGLEADMVVLLEASQMNARNLYVGLTRGSRSVVVCSKDSVLSPAL